jgi:glycosyltransferase involved in cell wall biosynthesis
MHILFDARSVRTPAGRAVLTGLTTGWLRDRRVSRVSIAVPPWLDLRIEGAGHVSIAGAPWPVHLLSVLPGIARAIRADVVFVPNALPPRDARAVAYFQDLHHFRASETRLSSRLRRALRRAWWTYALSACRLGVAVSRDIEAEVSRTLRVPVKTIPLGIDVGPQRWTGTAPSIFVMGGTGERKREDLALSAWAKVPAALRIGTRLVVGGVEPAGRRSRFAALASELGISRDVDILGALPRERYLGYVAESRAALSCSSLEAFGLPVAEALALGAPVLCSAIPAHEELLASSGAGRSFEVDSAEALADGIGDVLRGGLPERLRAVPEGWSWNARARAHLDLYQTSLEAA